MSQTRRGPSIVDVRTICACALTLLVAACSAGQSSSSFLASPRNVAAKGTDGLGFDAHSPEFVAGHVYVATLKTVLEYPLVDGVAATSPDTTLKPALPPSFGGIGSIAIDPSGNLYVLASSNQVDIYPPGAKGSDAPSGILTVRNGSSSVAEDARGNLYVASAGYVGIYAPGSTGSAAPIAKIQTATTDEFVAMAMSGTTLYGSTALKVMSYTNALTNPTLSKTFCTANTSTNGRVNTGIAIIESRLFLSQNGGKGKGAYRIAIVSLNAKARCPSKPASLFVSPASALFDPYNLASSGDALFVANGANALQLPAVRGPQAPVSTMKAAFDSPVFSIAIGP